MTFAVDLREAWMDDIEAVAKWMTLFSADPDGLAIPTTVEISGDVFARQESLWTRTGPATLTLAEVVRFRNLPPGTVIAAVGAFDGPLSGTIVFSDPVAPEPLEYPSGGTFTIPAGEYELRIE
jgi:hypothetical protein